MIWDQTVSEKEVSCTSFHVWLLLYTRKDNFSDFCLEIIVNHYICTLWRYSWLLLLLAPASGHQSPPARWEPHSITQFMFRIIYLSVWLIAWYVRLFHSPYMQWPVLCTKTPFRTFQCDCWVDTIKASYQCSIPI